MNKALCLLVFASSLLLSSCHSGWSWKHPLRFKRKIQTTLDSSSISSQLEHSTKELSKLSKERVTFLEEFSKQVQRFSTLSARAKVYSRFHESSMNLGLAMRIKKDSIIWMSVTALAGLEVARVLITPDSIKIIDRFNGKYIVKGFDYIHTMVSPEVDFQLLQASLTGSLPLRYLNDSVVLTKDTSAWLFSGLTPQVAYKLRFKDAERIWQAHYEDRVYVQSFDAQYKEHQQVDNVWFPFVIAMVSDSGKDKMELVVNYTKIERNKDLDFPFNPPKSAEEK